MLSSLLLILCVSIFPETDAHGQISIGTQTELQIEVQNIEDNTLTKNEPSDKSEMTQEDDSQSTTESDQEKHAEDSTMTAQEANTDTAADENNDEEFAISKPVTESKEAFNYKQLLDKDFYKQLWDKHPKYVTGGGMVIVILGVIAVIVKRSGGDGDKKDGADGGDNQTSGVMQDDSIDRINQYRLFPLESSSTQTVQTEQQRHSLAVPAMVDALWQRFSDPNSEINRHNEDKKRAEAEARINRENQEGVALAYSYMNKK